MTEMENPYQSPMADPTPAVGVLSGLPQDVRSVAVYQKGILICILVYFVTIFGMIVTPTPLRPLAAIPVFLTGVGGFVFVLLLSIKVYGVGAGIVLGMLTMLPCFGIIVLLIVNTRATRILQQNGHRVGLLGADLSEF